VCAALLLSWPVLGNSQTIEGAVICGSNSNYIAENPVTNTIYVVNTNSPASVSVVNGSTLTLTATVPVGLGPTGIAVNPVTNKIYVPNGSVGTVTVIDGATNTTTTVSLGLGGIQYSIALNPVTNKIYVTNFNAGSVSVIDGVTNAVTTVPVGTDPEFVAVNPVTNTIYVTNPYSNAVTVINGATNATATVTTGTFPNSIAVNPVTNLIYTANQDSNNVTVINGATNATATIAADSEPQAVAVNPVTNMIYVTNAGTSDVTVINGATNAATNVFVGGYPSTLQVNPITNKIYIPSGSSITTIDGATNAVSSVTIYYSGLLALDPATNQIYNLYSGSGTGSVIALDGATNTTATVTAGTTPYAVAVNPATNTAYVANQSGGVTVINGATNATTTVTAGTTPYAIAVNPATNTAYVANQGSNNVTVINGATNATTTVPAGTAPQAVAVNPATNMIYVVNKGSNNVTVINGATNTTTTVGVGTAPFAVAVNSATDMIYVTNSGSNNVTVINGVTNATATVTVGTTPYGIAVNPVTNQIYVANNGSTYGTIIDGPTNTPTQTNYLGGDQYGVAVNPMTNKIFFTVGARSWLTEMDGVSGNTTPFTVGTLPEFLLVNPVTNKIYVGNYSSANVSVVDGSYNSAAGSTGTSTVTVGTSPYGMALNPVTNQIYVANQGSGNVTVITEQQMQSSPLTTTITPLTGNATTSATPTFTFSASSSFAPNALPVDGVYFQFDSWWEPWTLATAGSGNSYSGTAPSLTPGTHILYAYATDGQDATATNTGFAGDTLIGSISAYLFTVSAPASAPVVSLTTTLPFPNTTAGTTSSALAATLSNTGTAALSISGISIAGTNPTDFAVSAGTNACGASLAAGSSCSIYVTFTPASATSYTAMLEVADNASGSPQTTTLTGTGIAALTPQTISFTQPTTPVTYSSGLTIPLAATGGGSGNPVVFTIDGSSTGTGSITGSTLTVTAAGTFVIDANQAGNSSYSAAPQVQRTVVVTQGSQVAQLQFTPSQLKVIAGTGSGTVNGTGDGGSALLATFDSPAGVAQDSLGNIYVVDQAANYVRKFDVNGNITAFAGVPGYGPGSFSGDNGQATAAHLSNPIGIAIDSSNNVYIADTGNFRIRKVVPSTGVITTYAGTGNGFFTGANAPNTVIPGPEGIAFDSSNNLYIACTNASLVLKVASSGATTIAAGVLGTSGSGTPGYNGDNILANTAEVDFPSAVATDSAGNVYIADTSNNRIRKITVSTGMITTVAGNGTAGDTGDGAAATSAEIYATAVAVDLAGDIFIASDSNGNPPGFDAVRKVDVNGNISTFAGSGSGSTGGAATAAQIGGIGIPAVDSNGDLIIPDYGYNLSTDEVMSSGPAGYLQFGNQSVGFASAAQTVTFENTGNVTLTLSQTTYTATLPFTVTGGTCVGRTTLASGATCTLTVTFTPTSAIAYTGSIAVNSNDTLAAQTITLAGTGVSTPVPVVSLVPSPVAFGNQTINTTSTPAMVVVLMNTGTAALTGISISVTGTNANAFGLNSSACGTTLAAGASCNISLNFTPSATGPNSASLSVSDNASNSPQSVTLTGTGLAANVVAPSPLVFNPAPVGVSLASAQTLTATFQMNGYAAGFTPTATLHYGLSYSIGAVSCTGTAGSETCSVPVTFQPQYPGGRRDAIFLMSGTTRLATALIYGIGQGPFAMVQPGLITNPPLSTSFYYYTSIVDENGTVYVLGDNSNMVFTVTKAGVVGTLPITGLNSPRGIGIDGAGVLYIADQTYNGPTKTYDTVQAIQGSVPFPVPSTYIQSLGVGNTGNIYETDYVHVYTVPVSGTGTAATTVITPANTQASNLIVDSNENLFVGGYEINEITSGGVQSQINTVGALEGIGVDPADTIYATRYTLGGVAELPASSYSTALAYLDPTASPLGMSVGPDGTVYVGNYTALDKVDRTQGLIAFGEQTQTLGTASPQQIVTIYNGGNQTLTISNIAITGSPFSIQTATTGTNCSNGGTVAPGALCEIAVVVTPAHAGVFSGSITVTSNSLNTASTNQTIALTAFAYGVYVTPSPTSLTFPNQIVNTTSAAQTITLTNNGDLYTASFGTPVSGSPVYSIGLGTCSTGIAVGASCNLSITFTPAAAQSYNNVTVTVPYSSSGGGTAPTPITFTLNGTGIPAAAPQAVLSPNPLAFPGTLVGTPALTMPMTLSNPGTAALAITSISVTGANASSFGETNNCGASLAAGATCTITVTFTPTATGGLSAAISVADNATGSPQSAVVTGTGTQPQAVLSPNPLAFPNTLVGTAATALPMTLSNPGTAALTITSISVTGTNASSFGETNNCGASLAAGATCTITVAFTPGSTGGLSAAISVADNATGSPQSAVVTGTGTQPQAVLSPNPLAFPSTRVGTSATALPMTLSNPGTAALAITSISVTGTNASSFGESNNCGASLAAGATCTITVTFTPGSAGGLSAAISVADNASGSPQSATITGTGTQPQAVLSPNPLAFPSTLVGTAATALPMTLSNPGTAALTITSISVTGTNASSFGETNNCGASLAVGATCTITVTFTPASAASLTASISVTDNASGSPQSATINGTGTPPLIPQAVLSPNPLAFPSTTINTSATPLPMTLSNPGNTALTITSISVTGTNASSFGETNNCGTSLAAGATCTITVSFTPTAAASLTAAISVTDNAAGSPQSATITGTGSAGTYAVNSSTPTASIQPGAVAQYNLNIVPLGGSFNNLVTLSATGLPAGALVSFLPPAVTPGSAGAPSVMSIQTSTGLARLAAPELHRRNPVPLLAVLAGLPLLGLAAGRRRLRRSSQRWMLLGLAVLATLPALALSGCGGGYFGPAPQTYTVTVVGTSGSLQETTTVSLIVQ
jgi:YVTN family beta-propeller protein